MLDGVYRSGTDGAPVFTEVPAPTDVALQAVLHKIITRTTQAAHPSGVLVEEEGSTCVADNDNDNDGDGDSDEARALRPLQAAPGQRPGPSPGSAGGKALPRGDDGVSNRATRQQSDSALTVSLSGPTLDPTCALG